MSEKEYCSFLGGLLKFRGFWLNSVDQLIVDSYETLVPHLRHHFDSDSLILITFFSFFWNKLHSWPFEWITITSLFNDFLDFMIF